MLITHGFVLSKKDIREYDREYCFFTKKYGKINLIAKSVRKPLSKLSAQLEPPALIEIAFVPSGDKGLITTALIKKNFLKTRKNLSKFKTYLEISNVVNELTDSKQPDVLVWNLINSSINNLENWNSKFIEIYFLAKFIKLLGFCPNTSNCINCQKTIRDQKAIYFDKDKWGFCCDICRTNGQEAISWQLFKSIDLLVNSSFEEIVKNELHEPIELRYKDIKSLLKKYIKYIKKYF